MSSYLNVIACFYTKYMKIYLKILYLFVILRLRK